MFVSRCKASCGLHRVYIEETGNCKLQPSDRIGLFLSYCVCNVELCSSYLQVNTGSFFLCPRCLLFSVPLEASFKLVSFLCTRVASVAMPSCVSVFFVLTCVQSETNELCWAHRNSYAKNNKIVHAVVINFEQFFMGLIMLFSAGFSWKVYQIYSYARARRNTSKNSCYFHWCIC